MARARNIKPGFFKNEILVEQSLFVRMLFIGLWTLADREGRVEDRPKRIKLELFPYDSESVDEGMKVLVEHGFVERYESAGIKVISIVNFLKHQTPHGTEKDSDLPGKDGAFTVHERSATGYVTGNKRSNNVKSNGNNVSSPLVHVNPLLDNLLNPDSPNHESIKTLEPTALVVGKPPTCPQIAESAEIPEKSASSEPAFVPEDKVLTEKPAVALLAATCPADDLVALYHELMPLNPPVKVLNDARRRAIRARWKEAARLTCKPFGYTSRANGLAAWRQFFEICNDSEFLTGRSPPSPGKPPFIADIDFIFSPSGFAKIIENKYHRELAA